MERVTHNLTASLARAPCGGADEFIRGKRHSLDERNKRLRAMRLEPPGNGTKHAIPLADLSWDAETLRLLLQQMLSKYGVGTADVMRVWDSSGDGSLRYARQCLRETRACTHVALLSPFSPVRPSTSPLSPSASLTLSPSPSPSLTPHEPA